MTVQQSIESLPEMPKREDADKWIALFPANDTIKASAIAGFHQAEVSALRVRLALLLKVSRAYLDASGKLYLKDRVIVNDKTVAKADLRAVTEALEKERGA